MGYQGKQLKAITTSVEYGTALELSLVPADGYTISTVTVINADTSEVVEVISNFETINGSTRGIKIESISNNLQIKVLFAI